MIQTLQTRRAPRRLAWALAVVMAGPVLAGLTGCGNSSSGGSTTAASQNTTDSAPPVATPPSNPSAMAPNPGTKPGLSKGQKVVIALAGAALLYYLYRKHQAAQQAQGTTTSGGQPQLYRSKNGGVYYRDPQNPQHVTWLTVPNQPVQVSADDVQRYAPDYQQYQGQPAPPAPPGYAEQSFSDFNSSAAGR